MLQCHYRYNSINYLIYLTQQILRKHKVMAVLLVIDVFNLTLCKDFYISI